MREIEFRAKNINYQWRYGYLERQDLLYDENYDCSSSIQIETVGQYTGLKDKNGTKIFEGDIVSCHTELLGECLFKIIYHYAQFRLLSLDERRCCVIEPFEMEVIGNIYDNPEILEGCNA